MTVRTRLETLFTQGAQAGSRPYLVLDGTWQEALVQQVRRHGEGWEPLMSAARRELSHQRSPLLVDLTLHPEVLDPWLKDDFGERLGIVVFSPLGIAELRASLKRFLTVLDPDNQRVYLRFWDARALYCFLVSGYPSQWTDFFRGIEVIVAPSDLSDQLSLYKHTEQGLTLGVEGLGTVTWHEIENRHLDEPHYEATFPFRKIYRRQYDEMEECARLTFHAEIMVLLQRAFPEEAAAYSRQDLLGFIERAHQTATREGYDSEDCARYWAVLSFMGGERFHEETATALYLQIRYLSQETKLERLIDEVNKSLRKKPLHNLTDVWDIYERYE